ncbi:hypothetical protein ABT336_02220 [Micromonospora sp. NPDC000207]|uniref:hypothetical protein n=1 Tax=Micromonospora sp. NPDC000207 TaxID=3154246 RepID=UPI00332EEC90
MPTFEEFEAGLIRPPDPDAYTLPTVRPDHVTISDWCRVTGRLRQPGPREVQVGDLEAFTEATGILPDSYELVGKANKVVGLRPKTLLTDVYLEFTAGLDPPAAGDCYCTPQVEPTHHTVSQWLRTTDREFHRPSKITEKDLWEFLHVHNLKPGSYRIVRNWSSRPVGLERTPAEEMAERYFTFRAGLIGPTGDHPYAIPTAPPDPEIIAEWLMVTGRRRHDSQSLRIQNLDEFAKEHNLAPDYSFVWENRRVVGLKKKETVGKEYQEFLAKLWPPTAENPYSTPGVEPTHHTVSQWLRTTDRKLHHPSKITADDLREFLNAQRMKPQSYALTRNSNRDINGLRRTSGPGVPASESTRSDHLATGHLPDPTTTSVVARLHVTPIRSSPPPHRGESHRGRPVSPSPAPPGVTSRR